MINILQDCITIYFNIIINVIDIIINIINIKYQY